MIEHRQSPRQRTYKGGRISFDRAPDMDCIIRNLSVTGACIEVEARLVPDHFRLVIKPELLSRNCRVAWRMPQKIGVQFV